MIVADAVNGYQRLTPQEKCLAHASRAAMLLAWWCYLIVPTDKSNWTETAILLCIGSGFALYLAASWRAASGPRSYGTAFFRLLLIAVCVELLWQHVTFITFGPVSSFLLRGFCWAALAANVVRFLIAAQLIGGGSAVTVLNRNIKSNAVIMRPAVGRWWRFW